MQRLIDRVRILRLQAISTDQRGAVAIMMAFLMVALIGFAAISIDVAGMWSERQRLQTGADAAALAIAQDCARGNCGTPSQTATDLAVANYGGGKDSDTVAAAVLTPSVTPQTGTVTVQATSTSHHLFAPVLGHQSAQITAQATARWGAPSSGIAVLPLTFSYCEWLAQTGGGQPSTAVERTIRFTKSSGTTCTNPSNLVVPGGFGWVTPNGGPCATSSAIGDTLTSDTGASVPGTCTDSYFIGLQNQVVLLPIFDQAGGTGTGAWYHIYAYAAFKITGYSAPGVTSWNGCGGGSQGACLKGYFVSFADSASDFQYSTGVPQLGADVVKLTA